MILTMLLHLLRHFAYDRYRGFRWFSWVSGGILLWLVYLAGINGFMLVWDQLAQFVVTASSEWLDVLPVFNGALIRMNGSSRVTIDGSLGGVGTEDREVSDGELEVLLGEADREHRGHRAVILREPSSVSSRMSKTRWHSSSVIA